MAKIFATFNVMIYSNDLFEMLSSTVGHNRQVKVTVILANG